MKRSVKIVVGLIVVGGVAYGAKFVRDNFIIRLPDYPPMQKVVWLDQGWQPREREWYHHANQGTVTFGIPLEWFKALEQPSASFGAVARLSDPTYLDKFGFIPGSADGPAQDLPVGIATGGPMPDPDTGKPWQNPQTHADMTRIGFTCAACHTGRMTYQGTTILIDGGSALTDLGRFRTAVGLSLLFTKRMPYRFGRFADTVLGLGASDAAKDELAAQLDKALGQVKLIHELDKKVEDESVVEGYGRLDALNRIGNQVFALDLRAYDRPEDEAYKDNYVGTSAPVHYPRIWSAPWFDWVQYNGSIEQPMVRNAGEALGVGALLNLTDSSRPFYASGIEFKTLSDMEQMLAGEQPDAERGFGGLKSPAWPADILPPIKDELAVKGAALYKEMCQECHLAPVTTREFWNSGRWLKPNRFGQRYFEVELVPVEHIGTDPAQAQSMIDRKVKNLPAALGIDSEEFGPALGQLVEKTVNQWYDSETPPASQELRDRMNGYRDNGIQALPKYKVRPLNGIWATPPYLHNGSVPTLYALLSPVEERPKTFYLGDREYDPVNVGYRTDKIDGGFEFDTTIPGNLNTGHEFNNGPPRKGLIGRLLTPDERRALIEFLKRL
jgi:hypothetical protein